MWAYISLYFYFCFSISLLRNLYVNVYFLYWLLYMCLLISFNLLRNYCLSLCIWIYNYFYSLIRNLYVNVYFFVLSLNLHVFEPLYLSSYWLSCTFLTINLLINYCLSLCIYKYNFFPLSISLNLFVNVIFFCFTS